MRKEPRLHPPLSAFPSAFQSLCSHPTNHCTNYPKTCAHPLHLSLFLLDARPRPRRRVRGTRSASLSQTGYRGRCLGLDQRKKKACRLGAGGAHSKWAPVVGAVLNPRSLPYGRKGKIPGKGGRYGGGLCGAAVCGGGCVLMGGGDHARRRAGDRLRCLVVTLRCSLVSGSMPRLIGGWE